MKSPVVYCIALLMCPFLLCQCGSAGGGGSVTPVRPYDPAVYSDADKIESSLDPLVFLPGSYTVQLEPGVAPPISIIDASALPNVITGTVDYTMTLARSGADSLALTLSGQGSGGSFSTYSLGRWAVKADPANIKPPLRDSNGMASGSLLIYKLIRKGGSGTESPEVSRDISSSTATVYRLTISLYSVIKKPPSYQFQAEQVAPASLVVRFDGKRKTTGIWH